MIAQRLEGSRFGAIGYGHEPQKTQFDESDWTEPNDGVIAYIKSKTLAERAARNPAVRLILPDLGKVKNGTSEKAKRMLGWKPRSNEEAIIATAESLMRLGLLKGA